MPSLDDGTRLNGPPLATQGNVSLRRGRHKQELKSALPSGWSAFLFRARAYNWCILPTMRTALFFTLALTVASAQTTPPAKPPAPAKPAAPTKAPATKPSTPAPPTAGKPAPTLSAPPTADGYAQLEMMTRAMEMIRQNYVDEKKVTYEELVEGALEGMLRRLDPHCEYMGRSLFEEMQREQSDTSEGVGITVSLRLSTLTIITVREDGPAARAGVLAGDQIVRINDVLTDSVGVAESMQLLKGKAGESVRLTVRRPGTKQFLDFSMVRETLTESSVHDAMLIHPKLASDSKIGYARVSTASRPPMRRRSSCAPRAAIPSCRSMVPAPRRPALPFPSYCVTSATGTPSSSCVSTASRSVSHLLEVIEELATKDAFSVAAGSH